MIDLAAILDEYGGEVYADFQKEYGINLVAEIRDGVRSAGEILELIWQLEEHTRLAKAWGGDNRVWSLDRLFMMDVANQLRILNYYYLAGHGQKPKKPDLHETPTQVAARQEEEARNTPTPETVREMERRKKARESNS